MIIGNITIQLESNKTLVRRICIDETDANFGSQELVLKVPDQALQVIPVRQETWDNWVSSENYPSFAQMGKLEGKGTKAKRATYRKLPDYAKAVMHVIDIVADLTGNQRPIAGKDFKLNLKQD